MFEGVFNTSIIKRAQGKGLLKLHVHDLRRYTLDKHKKVDDRPFGGGPGMVMMAEPIFRAVESIKKAAVLGNPQGAPKLSCFLPRAKPLPRQKPGSYPAAATLS